MKKLTIAMAIMMASFGAQAGLAGFLNGVVDTALEIQEGSSGSAEQAELQRQHEEFQRQHNQNHQNGMRNSQLNNCAHFSDNAAQCELEARRQWEREDQGSW